MFVLVLVAASKAIPERVLLLFVLFPLVKATSRPLTVVAPDATDESVTFKTCALPVAGLT